MIQLRVRLDPVEWKFFVFLVEFLRTWKCGVGTSVSSFCAVFLWYFVVLEGVMERAFQKARVA